MKWIEQKIIVAAAVMGSIGGFSLAADAAPAAAEMDAAIKQYKGGHSGAALAQFRAMSAKDPTNPLVHYWMALCAQNLHQMALAKQEYEWVASYSRDPQLKNLGAKGAAGLGGYSKTAGATAAAPEPAKDDTKSGATKTADSKADAKTEKKADAKKEPKVAQVIKICTPTDRQSAVFAPAFDEVKSSPTFKGISFSECDATASQNESNITKWNAPGYPALVYLDSKGNVLQTQSAIGLTSDSITATINQLNSAK